MKKLVFSLVGLILLLAGCNQGPASEDIAKLAYEWEKARFDRDYEKQQELLYEEGSFEIDKDAEKKESGLKYDDILFEIYFDEELGQYFVFTDFKNPQGENTINNELVIRKKDDGWKIDQNQKVNREVIKKGLEREACINCE